MAPTINIEQLRLPKATPLPLYENFHGRTRLGGLALDPWTRAKKFWKYIHYDTKIGGISWVSRVCKELHLGDF